MNHDTGGAQALERPAALECRWVRTAATTCCAWAALKTGLIGIATFVRDATSVPGSGTVGANSRIAGCSWVAAR